MAESLQEIQHTLIAHKKELYGRYRVKELGVFGSYARGEQKKRSDIDILVEFSVRPDVFTLIDLEDHLKRLLKKKVDVVRKKAVRPELRKAVLDEVVYI
jgi:predicted nucleotidyltransferase